MRASHLIGLKVAGYFTHHKMGCIVVLAYVVSLSQSIRLYTVPQRWILCLWLTPSDCLPADTTKHLTRGGVGWGRGGVNKRGVHSYVYAVLAQIQVKPPSLTDNLPSNCWDDPPQVRCSITVIEGFCLIGRIFKNIQFVNPKLNSN